MWGLRARELASWNLARVLEAPCIPKQGLAPVPRSDRGLGSIARSPAS